MHPSPASASIGRLTKLAQGSLATVHAFRHHAHPHRDPADEAFDQPTIIFTLAGQWDFRSQGISATIHPGILVLGRAGQHYRCRHHEEIPTDRHLCLSIREPALQDLASQYPPHVRPPGLKSAAFPSTVLPHPTAAIRRLQHALLAETIGDAPAQALRVDLVAMDLLLEIYRTFGINLQEARLQDWRARVRVDAAQEYMVAHVADAIDLATLARVAALSPYHFARLFRQHVGRSPHQYLIRLRVEHAAKLLKSSALPVTQVCYEAGFRSLSHFITTFRKHVGSSPSRYRSLPSR